MRLGRLTPVLVGVGLLLGGLSAEARRGHRGDATWVPQKAWRAVKKFARAKYDPHAQLFKTDQTKSQSLGLKGANGRAAFIVGARARQQNQPHQSIMPYQPSQTYFLVAKNSSNQWKVTPLAGMGGYLSKVDAREANPRVGVGVGLFGPGQVCHGVEVSNTRNLRVTEGTQLATKQNGPQTHTVYVKGDTGGRQWAIDAKAKLRASVPPPPGSWCGTPLPKSIPVHFSQVMFAQGGGPTAQ